MTKVAFLAVILLLARGGPASAQQLEPRAYWPAPVGLSVAGVAYFFSSGNEVLDPAVPIQNLQARVQAVAPYYGRSFGLLGRQASITVAAPFAHADIQGDITAGTAFHHTVDRTGFGDPAVRLAVNLIGLPALSREEFKQREPEATVGGSLTVIAPFGQYDRAKLINLGSNRWSCKPEVGYSQPVGKWAFEVFAGLWMFTANDEFYGNQVKRQEPLASYQGHIIYHVTPLMWAALDYTYFTGGATTLNGQNKGDRQDNSRVGVTLALPVTAGQSFKMSAARGVSTRIGSNYDTYGAAWQWNWF